MQNEGINVKKMSPNTLMIVNLISPDGRYDSTFLSNYATIYVKDELGRLPGVAGITYLGQRDYSLRAWLDPDKLAALNLSAMDVVTAISQQNVQVAAGQIGQQPVPAGQQFQLTINTLGRLTEPEQFADIILKTGQGPSMRDNPRSIRCPIASNPGSSNTSASSTNLSGLARADAAGDRDRPAARRGPASSSARSSTTSPAPWTASRPWPCPSTSCPAPTPWTPPTASTRKMKELKTRFPDGLDYQIVYDTTPFIRESVNEVFYTLRDAVILVAIVVLVFLQDWRAMILPMIDVPVSLIGTFAVMALMGFTLNNLTLFGLVLAIGIVVDDAIVVLENIERLIATGLDARTATIKAMEEITGPVLAITLVLSSVFIPCCFLGGISGQFFRQFAVTIAVSTIISAINALTMTPSRAVLIFKTEEGTEHGHQPRGAALVDLRRPGRPAYRLAADASAAGPIRTADGSGARMRTRLPEVGAVGLQRRLFHPGRGGRRRVGWFIIRPVNAVLGWFFRGFNRVFDWMTALYGGTVGRMLRVSVIVLVVYGGLLVLTYWQFNRTPTGFIPQQDKGYLILNVQLPDSASVERTERVMAVIESVANKTHGSRAHGRHLRQVADPERQRAQPRLDVRPARRLRQAAQADGRRIAAELQETLPPGGAPGHGLRLRRAADRRPGHDRRLQAHHRGPRQSRPGRTAAGQRRDRRARQPDAAAFRACSTAPGPNTPWLYLDIDRTKCMALGVQVSDVFNTLQVYLGSYYVNNFNEFGRTWQVNVQADPRFRSQVADIRQLQVAKQPGPDGPPGHAAGRARHQRAGDGDALQHVLGRRHHRQRGAGHQLGAGDRPDAGDRRPGIAAVDGLRMDRAGLPAAPGRQHGHVVLRSWRWCSSSWCWRPSTRAGSCRWRSSWWCRCACSAPSSACNWPGWK